MSIIREFFQKIGKSKHQPLSPDQTRNAKVKIIEDHLGCHDIIRAIADNDRVDHLIADVESKDILRQTRALRVLNIPEINAYLFDSLLMFQLHQIDDQK